MVGEVQRSPIVSLQPVDLLVPSAPCAIVLIVEDDEPVRALLGTVVARAGFTVEVARNGVEAIRKIGACSYDAILLDLNLPLVSGFEVIAELERSAPDLLRERVIVLTAVSNTELRRLDGKHIYRIVQKPFDLDDLVATVTGCCNHRASVS
jgi:two-component system, NtrC family, nitrogen regulation response regulator GlnG